MTQAQHEQVISKWELLLLQADTREDRAAYCAAFLCAIAERNNARSIAELIALEKRKGLRA